MKFSKYMTTLMMPAVLVVLVFSSCDPSQPDRYEYMSIHTVKRLTDRSKLSKIASNAKSPAIRRVADLRCSLLHPFLLDRLGDCDISYQTKEITKTYSGNYPQDLANAPVIAGRLRYRTYKSAVTGEHVQMTITSEKAGASTREWQTEFPERIRAERRFVPAKVLSREVILPLLRDTKYGQDEVLALAKDGNVMLMFLAEDLVKAMSDANALGGIAMDGIPPQRWWFGRGRPTPSGVRCKAIAKITDMSILDILAQEDPSVLIRHVATARIRSLSRLDGKKQDTAPEKCRSDE